MNDTTTGTTQEPIAHQEHDVEAYIQRVEGMPPEAQAFMVGYVYAHVTSVSRKTA